MNYIKELGGILVKDIVNELKDRALKITILKVISEGEICGYDLIETIDTKSKGYFNTKEKSFYPILYGLEADEIIENNWKNEDFIGQSPRKYYRLTDKGYRVLKELLGGWKDLLEGTSRILT